MLTLRSCFLSVLLLTVASILQADTVRLKDFQASYPLGSYLVILEDSSEELDAKTVSAADFNGFQPLGGWDKEFKTNTVYWGKLQLVNDLPDAENLTEWVLSFTTSLTNITLYYEVSPGIFQTYYSGTHQPIAKKSFAPTSEGNFIRITLPPHQPGTLYFSARADREALPPEFDLSLEHVSVFYKNLNDEKRDNSLFLGFVLMMLFYNFIMFAFMKDKAYLYYCIYLLSLSVYVAYKNGDLADLLEPVLFPLNPKYVTFAKLSVHCTIAAYLAFIRKFSNLKVLLPKWDKVFQIVIAMSIPFLLMDAYLMLSSNFSYNISDRSTVSYTFIFIGVILGLTIPLAKTDDKKSRYIIAGITFLGIGIFLTLIARLQSYEFTLIWFKAGTILDIMAFSVGLAYRQLENEEEKQATRFQMEKTLILQEQEHAEALRLNEMNAIKSRFYTNITHEFRTPLSVIKGMAGEIKENDRARELIGRNADNLLNLINQMLDLAKLKSGKMQLKLQQGEVVSYLAYLVESFQSLADTRQIGLNFNAPADRIAMNYDEEKLRHILYNLLSNALKFTGEGGQVTVSVEETVFKNDPALKLAVKDSGVGISVEDIPHIFDRFYQVGDAEGVSTHGTGVGLSLSRELVWLMGGEISVESDLGKGTIFTVLLPLFPDVKQRQKGAAVVDSLNSRSLPVLPAEEVNTPEGIDSFSEQPEEEMPLLLLIEDHADVVIFLQTLLKDRYQIVVSTDGADGVRKAVEHIPDVILSDVMMPEKDGYEVCRILKADERTSHIPIVLLTAKSEEEDRIAGLEAGADAYLVKPFNKEELFVRLDKLVELRHTLQAHYKSDPYAEMLLQKVPGTNRDTSLDKVFLQKIRDFIGSNIEDHNLSIQDLCQEMHLSNTQLYRKVKALTGDSPNHLIRKIRLQRAVILLKTTEMNISEVAYQSGFNDPNYFSRIFQQEFEMPPSAVRK